MKNRIGGTVLRHTLDGSIVDTAIDTTQKKNTLPLTSGKSDVAKKNGFLQRGNTFSFEVKTIADLDQKDDKLSITPEFRYYTAQGNSKRSLYIMITRVEAESISTCRMKQIAITQKPICGINITGTVIMTMIKT